MTNFQYFFEQQIGCILFSSLPSLPFFFQLISHKDKVKKKLEKKNNNKKKSRSNIRKKNKNRQQKQFTYNT